MPLTKSKDDAGFQGKGKRNYGEAYHPGGLQGRPAPTESENTPVDKKPTKEKQ